MLRQRLYNYTANKPVRMFYSSGTPYLERYYVGSIGSLRFYLHRFVNGDGDRSLHAPPWKRSIAVCLCGGYLEHRIKWFNPNTAYDVSIKNLRPGWINIIKATTFHQIIETKPETWTLFIHGKKIKPWGFINKTTIRDESGAEKVVSHYLADEDKASHQNWWLRAPLGKDSTRAELGSQ